MNKGIQRIMRLFGVFCTLFALISVIAVSPAQAFPSTCYTQRNCKGEGFTCEIPYCFLGTKSYSDIGVECANGCFDENSSTKPITSEIEGEWELVNTPITIVFNEGSDSGHMYCNSYVGSYETKDKALNCGGKISIHFGDQFGTLVGCSENSQENEYITSLKASDQYEVCKNVLTMYSKGNQNLVFHKKP